MLFYCDNFSGKVFKIVDPQMSNPTADAIVPVPGYDLAARTSPGRTSKSSGAVIPRSHSSQPSACIAALSVQSSHGAT